MLRTLSKVVMAAIALASVIGCTENSTRPMAIEVRERATGLPVEGALVVAQTEHFYLYSLGDEVVDPSPPSVRGRTGALGTVLLDVPDACPVQIIASAPGFEPLRIDLDEHPARCGRTSPWLGAEGDFDGLEVRFAPP